jgi:hypothetical protein
MLFNSPCTFEPSQEQSIFGSRSSPLSSQRSHTSSSGPNLGLGVDVADAPFAEVAASWLGLDEEEDVEDCEKNEEDGEDEEDEEDEVDVGGSCAANDDVGAVTRVDTIDSSGDFGSGKLDADSNAGWAELSWSEALCSMVEDKPEVGADA